MFLPRLAFRNRFDKLLSGHGHRDHQHAHKKKRCAKKKCKERSEWSYIRGSTAHLDVSPYCSSHACQWREGNGTTCRNSKKSNKPYCRYHLTCQAAPYGNQCPSERSNPLNKDAKFCDLHGCSWSGCNNEILPPQGRKTFTYCKDHNCQQSDCPEARIGATGTRQSVYCAAHTCKDDHCMANVHGTPEAGDPKGQHGYCPVHRPCRHADCDSMVHRVSNAEYRKHCSNHYCEFGSNCDEQRASGAKVCGTHRCRRAGCAKGLQNAAGRYCEDHECKDSSGPCLEERVGGSEWCTRHICRDYFENCKNQGDPNKDHFCVDHVRCEMKGCTNKIFLDKGVRRQFCEDHYYGICDFIGCDLPRKSGNGNKHHCSKHACIAPQDCSNARTVSSMYCPQHKCSDPACETIRAPSASLSPSALKQLTTAGGAMVANLHIYDPWCATHRCRDAGCAAQAVAAGGLCATHVCRETGCAARANQDNGYCDQHCCRERGCLRAPVDAYHNYCDAHYHSDDDTSDDDSDAWSYANGGSPGGAFGGAADPGLNGGWLAGPGWSGPFGLGGVPRRRSRSRRRSRLARSRSGSRSRAATKLQKPRGSRKGSRMSRSRAGNNVAVGGNGNF